MHTSDEVPLVTLGLLRDAESGCGLRVHQRYTRAPAIRIPYGPARVRDAVVAALRTADGDPRETVATCEMADGLGSEEQRVFAHAITTYATLFADSPGTPWDLEVDRPTYFPKRNIKVLNPIDVALKLADGTRAIRLLRFGGRTRLPEPLDDDRVRMTILRVAVLDGAETPLRVTTADLLTGDSRSLDCTPTDLLPDLSAWLDAAIAAVTAREAQPTRGTECVRCQYIHVCPAHPQRAGGVMRRHDYLPPVVGFTPTSFDTWRRCPRQFLLGNLLRLPESDLTGSPDEGILVHRLLESIHREGDCHDERVTSAVLAAWGLETDARTRGFIERHRRRCPSGAPALGHEYAEARFHRLPLPNFTAAARYDAIWIHGGRLDVRDYKTGSGRLERVGDDPRARVQAWVLAPLAASLDLELSVRFELLAPEQEEDPEPFTPDQEDLAVITEELRTAAEQILDDDFPATADDGACGFCPYRSICEFSHAPGVPMWPTIGADPREPEPA